MSRVNKLRILLFLFLSMISGMSFAQNVGINSTGAAPNASAGLDVSFTDKGFLAPRMTLAQKLAISSPATGLLVYQTDGVPGFYYYSGSGWVFNGSASQWTTSGSNIYYLNKVGIGTSSSLTYTLTVNAASNPLFLSGVQEGSGLDSILLIANGIVKKRVYTATASTNAWALTGNSGQTAAAHNTGSYIGNSDSNPLRFRTNNTQRMFIGNTGGLAVGNNTAMAFDGTNPEVLLVDAGTTTSKTAIAAYGTIDSYLQLNIKNKSTGTSASSDVVATNDAGTEANGTGFIDMGINSSTNTTTGVLGGASSAYLYSTGNDLSIGNNTVGKYLRFFTNSSGTALERMRVESDGNIGIGSSAFSASPNAEKVLVDAGTTTTTGMSVVGTRNSYFQLNVQNKSSGTAASTDIVATASNGSNTTGYIDMGINGGGYADYSGNILNGTNATYMYGNGGKMIIGNGGYNFPLIFFTNSTGASTDQASGTERMRIDAAGNVGIGNFEFGAAEVSGGAKLVVDGSITPRYTGSTLGTSSIKWGQIYSTNGTINTSDRRLKKNIAPLNYGLKEVLGLQAVRYNWKDLKDTNNKIGLIAQDTRLIIPEVVYGDESKEDLGMNYSELVPVLINAIKEQQNQINDLKKAAEKNQVLIDMLLKKIKSE